MRALLVVGLVLMGGCSSNYSDVEVVDGDTIVVEGEVVRYACIDTPERGEGGHEAATRRNRALVSGGVGLERVGVGKYGRTLAHVWVEGVSVEAVLVGEGLARRWKSAYCERWWRDVDSRFTVSPA